MSPGRGTPSVVGMTTANASPLYATTAQPVPSMSRFVVRQKLTMMVNRYTIHPVDDDGNEGPAIAFAQQKRLALNEQVTFYADEQRKRPIFRFKARDALDLSTTYDVTDADGHPIGWFKKEFRKSLTRSTWRMNIPALELESVGTERSGAVALIRRIWNLVLEDVPGPWRFHFDFRTPDGTLVMSSDRRGAMRDVYDVELPATPDGSRVDWRLGAAMAVALDALQSR
jgi:uncharacterized protein YxjI